MCGLVGVFSKYQGGLTQELRDTFSTLLLVDTLRGDDSTGAFCVHLNGDMTLAKEASTAGQFLKSKEWKSLAGVAFSQGAALIGHNRKATRGVINDENAHPFVVDDKIVLVHNGGMWGDHKKHADVEVDSHAIAHLIAEHKDPAIALGKFTGAYALMWYDVEAESMNIIRNKERPLWWMETDSGWVWASEKVFLQFAAVRNNMKVTDGPKLLDEDTLQVFELKNRKWHVGFKKIDIVQDYISPGVMKHYTGFEDDDGGVFSSWKESMENALAKEENKACTLPQDKEPANKDGSTLPNVALDEQFTYTVGGTTWERTSEFERSMAKSCNKIVTMGEFNTQVINSYLHGTEVRCSAYEYVDDGLGGFYLYASPVDDQEIMFRHHFAKESKMSEERIMRMALNEFVFSLKVDTKSWAALEKIPGAEDRHQKGYCIISSSAAKLVEGGGITQKGKEHAF